MKKYTLISYHNGATIGVDDLNDLLPEIEALQKDETETGYYELFETDDREDGSIVATGRSLHRKILRWIELEKENWSKRFVGLTRYQEAMLWTLLQKRNFAIMDNKPLSKHKDDGYMQVVRVIDMVKNEHIVYVYNAKDNAFYEGSYHFEEQYAIEKFKSKGDYVEGYLHKHATDLFKKFNPKVDC